MTSSISTIKTEKSAMYKNLQIALFEKVDKKVQKKICTGLKYKKNEKSKKNS